ncbi:MAG: helix-hairpin-helix domain-containing protein, partial [Thermoleophilia bacterium]|nr:helix-hairpin-helix domain-containing protein [Thermoleophilia bacterium]
VGPGLAAKIIAYRTEHGGFRSFDELGEVPGIGDKRLESLRAQLQP